MGTTSDGERTIVNTKAFTNTAYNGTPAENGIDK